MKLEIFQPDALPEYIRYQILSFQRSEWPQGFQGRLRGRRWIGLPDFNPVNMVLLDDDFVVAHAEIMWIDFTHAGKTYKTYGLSSVFVYADYRRMGYGKRIVETATRYIAEQGDAQIGMLWCAQRLRSFYESCGWQPMDQTRTWLGDSHAEAQIHTDELLFMTFFDRRVNRRAFVDADVFFGWTTW